MVDRILVKETNQCHPYPQIPYESKSENNPQEQAIYLASISEQQHRSVIYLVSGREQQYIYKTVNAFLHCTAPHELSITDISISRFSLSEIFSKPNST